MNLKQKFNTKKIVIMLRFPRAEKSFWKIKIIETLIDAGYDVALVFAHKSIFSHAKFAYKLYGDKIFNSTKNLLNDKNNKPIYNYFKSRIKIIRVDGENSLKTEKEIRLLYPDLILLLGTGIIRKNILDIPNIGVIHVHQGNLPYYRGVNTIEWSILRDDSVYITSHFVTPGIDMGNIILKKKISISSDDNINIIREKCKNQTADLIIRSVKLVMEKNNEFTTQHPEEGKQYFEMHPFFKNLVELKIKKNYE